MNYYNKYIKYKIKYNNLKKMIGGGDDIIIVNLVWINNKLNDQKYIFPETIFRQKENITYVVADKINKWLDKNYKMYFWYNSKTITDIQLLETKLLFCNKNIEFRNIESILGGFEKLLECNIYIIV